MCINHSMLLLLPTWYLDIYHYNKIPWHCIYLLEPMRASPPFSPTVTPTGGGRGGSRYIRHRPPGNPKPTAGHAIEAALDGNLVCKFSSLQILTFSVWQCWRFSQWLVGGNEAVDWDRRKKGQQKLVAKERILLEWKKSNYAWVWCSFSKIVWWGINKKHVCFGRGLLSTTMQTAQMECGHCEAWRQSEVW
jgi:hypothetical protein